MFILAMFFITDAQIESFVVVSTLLSALSGWWQPDRNYSSALSSLSILKSHDVPLFFSSTMLRWTTMGHAWPLAPLTVLWRYLMWRMEARFCWLIWEGEFIFILPAIWMYLQTDTHTQLCDFSTNHNQNVLHNWGFAIITDYFVI